MINPDGAPEGDYEAPAATGALFFDDFQNGLDKWTHSEIPMYSGIFQVGQGAEPVFPGDQGLIIPEKARHYALSAPLSGLGDMSGKDFALQYEVKLDDGMTCGGAYFKLPTTGFPDSSKFDNSVPYSVMFGPDKCGATEKVHFIMQSRNPNSGELVEHHLKDPPALATSYDKHHHLYALYVRADGSFSIEVDGEMKREGALLEELEPPLQPAKEIDDKEDKKPDSWVDEQQIPDPEAEKPDDWDEDAPMEIVDEDAKKPDGWLDDEPETIPDPKAEQPTGWDEEEDGVWKAPSVPNPKCTEGVGCGEWKAPMKANPDYKGKWTAPMVKNPKYLGEWKPRKIDNPDFYEVKEAVLLPIEAVGLEIWTMDQGVVFDDVYIGTDVDAAKAYAKASFTPKKEEAARKDKAEKAAAEAEGKRMQEEANRGWKGAAKKFVARMESVVDALEQRLSPVEDLVVAAGMEKTLDKLIDMGVTKPLTVVVLMPIVIVLVFLALLAGGRKKPAVDVGKKTDAVTQDDEPAKEEKSAESEVTESEITESMSTAVKNDAEKVRKRTAKVE